MRLIFVNDCAADGCKKKNLGHGKQMCQEHQDMYEKGISFKVFYGKTVLKKEFHKSKLISTLIAGFFMSIFFASCTDKPIGENMYSDYRVKFLFEHNGCKMYRFYDRGHYVYWSDCQGKTQTNYQNKSNSYHLESITSK